MLNSVVKISMMFAKYFEYCTIILRGGAFFVDTLYTLCFIKKTGPFVISSYLCFGSYEMHENFQKYIGGVACCEYGINVCNSLTILC